MEFLTVKVLRSEFDELRSKFTYVDYKEVSFDDDFFKNDITHQRLKKDSLKAYKALKEYEFRKRNL